MNPFEIIFGKEPRKIIPREDDIFQIKNSFDDNISQCYLITGPRGTGKTVLLTQLSSYYEKQNDWIVININPEKDILNSLVAKIYSNANVSHLFLKKSLNIGIHGISLSLQSGQTIIDPENILEIMINEIKRQKKKLLISIDEITNNKEVKIFSHTFQLLLRKNLPVYLLMTGLPENLFSLQNEKTLTFLYRAPKLFLNRLNETSIYLSYLEIFKNEKMSKEMTKLVLGYAYAYQLLGMLVYDNKSKLSNDIIEKYDILLAENSYSKIWSELNIVDKKILKSIIKNNGAVSKIMVDVGMNKSMFSVYRKRLIDKGYVDGTNYGLIKINLPRFDVFVNKYSFD